MSDINEMNVGPRWYVAHTYSGYENKVKANLEKIIENRGLGHLIFDIRIPVETVIEKNGDTEKEVENKLFPCYVYVKMVMNEESWHAVRNIPGVTVAYTNTLNVYDVLNCGKLVIAEDAVKKIEEVYA